MVCRGLTMTRLHCRKKKKGAASSLILHQGLTRKQKERSKSMQHRPEHSVSDMVEAPKSAPTIPFQPKTLKS